MIKMCTNCKHSSTYVLDEPCKSCCADKENGSWEPREIFEETNKIVQKVVETNEEFIFSTLDKYIGTITEMKVSKEELVRAIKLIRLQRESLVKYGTMISNNWYDANRQVHDLENAYNSGMRDGLNIARSRFKDCLKNMSDKED